MLPVGSRARSALPELFSQRPPSLPLDRPQLPITTMLLLMIGNGLQGGTREPLPRLCSNCGWIFEQ
jgi:hypothetical protein